jgi:hypothetical protein
LALAGVVACGLCTRCGCVGPEGCGGLRVVHAVRLCWPWRVRWPAGCGHGPDCARSDSCGSCGGSRPPCRSHTQAVPTPQGDLPPCGPWPSGRGLPPSSGQPSGRVLVSRTLFAWLCAGGVVHGYGASCASTGEAVWRGVSVVIAASSSSAQMDDQRVGRTAGLRPCQRQIQETPRILIPFPEMVRPTRRRTGRVTGALRGAMSACGPERTPFIRRAS